MCRNGRRKSEGGARTFVLSGHVRVNDDAHACSVTQRGE